MGSRGRILKLKHAEEILPIVFMLIISILFHSLFIFEENNLVVNMDAINQYPFFYIHLLESFAGGNFFWSWSYGLGGDLWGEFAYYYATSPLFHAVVIAEKLFDFEWGILDVVTFKMYLSVFKSFFGMLGMYLLIRYEEFERWKALTSALTYGSAIIFFSHAALIEYLTETFIYVPFTIFGLLYYQRTGKSRYFILGIFLSLFSNYYMGFINSIFYGLAALILTPLRKHGKEGFITSLIRTYAPYALHYAIGLGLACIGFLPGILSVRESGRMALDPIIPAFFDRQWFLRLPEQIWSDLGYLGFPLITVIILFLLTTSKDQKTKRKSLLALILFICYFVPYMYSVFNGFSAIQYRWFHILSFSVAFALPNWLTLVIQDKRINRKHILMVAVAGLAILYTKQERTGIPVDKYDIGVFSFGLASLICLYVLSFKEWGSRRLLTPLLVVSVAANGVVNVTGFSEEKILNKLGAANLTDEYFQQYSLDNLEERRVFSDLMPRKEEFYRTQYITDHRLNHSMLYGYYGTSAYNSVSKENINSFIKTDFNVLQRNPLRNSNVVVAYSLFDQRWALETGLGIRYQVLAKDSEPPFDYQIVQETPHYFVYEHNAPVGLDMWYTQTILASEWQKLNPAQRDALFLNTLMVADKQAKTVDGAWQNYLPEEIPVIPDQVKYENMSYKNEILTVKENGALTIPIPEKNRAGEFLVYFDLAPIEDREVPINVNGKQTLKRDSRYIYNYGNESYVFRVSGQANQIELRLPAGTYQFSSMQIFWNSYEEFKKQTEERQIYNLENLAIDANKVSGNISVGEKGILFLSIPYSKGWNLKVNGEEQPIQEVQSSFVGIPLEEGDYEIALAYITPGFYMGFWISILSLFAAFALHLHGRGCRIKISKLFGS